MVPRMGDETTMNYRRGFFRIWLALSALWVLGTAFVVADTKSKYITDQAFVMKDATSGFYKLDNYFDRYDAAFKAAHWEVEFPNNVTLFVVNGIPKSVVEAKGKEFYQNYSEPRTAEMNAARFDYWSKGALIAIVPPFVLLCFGVLTAWIFAGFSGKHSS
jgi:hypothetical protein